MQDRSTFFDALEAKFNISISAEDRQALFAKYVDDDDDDSGGGGSDSAMPAGPAMSGEEVQLMLEELIGQGKMDPEVLEKLMDSGLEGLIQVNDRWATCSESNMDVDLMSAFKTLQ